jgi:hypothetical protein
MKTALLVSVCVVITAAAGCANPQTACTAVLVPALRVNIVDSVTNLPAASGTTLIAVRDGVEVDSVITPASPSNDANNIYAGDLPGTFTVTIKKALYADWIRTGVVVTSTDLQCRQPQTLHVVATIRKLP